MLSHTDQDKRIRWKSNRFELERGANSHWYWLMLATDRKTRIPLNQSEVAELRDLLDVVLQEFTQQETETL